MVSRASGTAAGAGSTANNNYQQTQSGMEIVNKSGTSQTNSSSSEWQSKVSDYMDPVSRAALNQLIKSLSGSGVSKGSTQKTSDAHKYGQIRLEEIAANQASRGDYSKANAFADAIGAMNSQLAKGIESQMPTITAGIDAAGTSGSAMAALLTQQAAEDAARNAAELGLTAAVNYGQLQVGFGDIIERLSAAGDPVTNQLLEALGIAKGASEKTTTSGSSKSSSSTTSNEIATSTSTGTTSGKETVEEGKTAPKSGSYTFQKFPGMSTPGYSSSFKQQTSGNTGSSYGRT